MNKILTQLKIQIKEQDLLSDQEKAKHEHVLNTFEHIAENNTNKSMKYVIAITAEELGMKPEKIIEILDMYYQSEDTDDE